MIQQNPETEQFKEQLRISLRRETQNARAINIAKHDNLNLIEISEEHHLIIKKNELPAYLAWIA